jgi:urease accessory protein
MRKLMMAILAATPAVALAHPGHGAPHDSAFAAGLMHPLLGLDHLAAMVAVGLWAAQLGGRMLWALPLAFAGTMVVGAGLGMAGVPLPLVEAGILTSLLVIGLAVAAARRLPAPGALALVALFALLHGHAHGTELQAGASAGLYVAGFVLTTALLHAAGIGAALGARRIARRDSQGALAVRLGGAAVMACGAAMIAGLL